MNDMAKMGDSSAVPVTNDDRPSFFEPMSLDWAPWVMEGTHFKLLNVDGKTGGFTLLLKVDPGVVAPTHGHLGMVEGIILEGEFGYDEDDRGGPGAYIMENGGVDHQPDSPGGTTMFAIAYGPLCGYNPDGTVAAIVDAKMMYALAKEAGQLAPHIKDPMEA
ncbi:MAG: 2,4'-dihydroxyacetophenone dioxygenase family protein [Pseudomonadota bacterium]